MTLLQNVWEIYLQKGDGMKTNVTLSLDVDFAKKIHEFAMTHGLQKSQIHAQAVESFITEYEKKKRVRKK